MTKQALFAFAETLRPFLAPPHRHVLVTLNFRGPQTAKHLIESLGVPHTQVGQLLVDDRMVQLDYQVRDGDRLEVQAVAGTDRVDAGPAGEPRFVLDGHLGRLAAHLRMLGLDCLYRNNYTDDELAQVSVNEGRILLTRDRHLLMRKVVTQGFCPRSLEPEEQLEEVVRRFGLTQWIRPFQRCLRCNTPLQPASKESVQERLEPLTKKYFDEFHICPACSQIYWKGSHYDRMLKVIERLACAG